MAFARMYNNPSLRSEQYDGIVAKMGIEVEPALEAAGIVRPAPEIWQVHNLIQP